MHSAASEYLSRFSNTCGLMIRSTAHPASSTAAMTDIIVMYFLMYPRNSLIYLNPFRHAVVFCNNRDYNVHIVF